MSKTALLPIADGFEEIEALSIIDVLRRAEINVKIASLMNSVNGLVVNSARNVQVICDNYLEQIYDQPFDLIVLAGGMGNAKLLAENKMLEQMLKKQKEQNKLYAAICASPALVFEKQGLLIDREATCYPSLNHLLSNKNQVEERVVISHNCITSQGPGTSIEFALALVEKLIDQKTATQLAKQLLLKK